MAEGTRIGEGLEILKAVRGAVPQAHVILAQYYLREGRLDAAQRELADYSAHVSGAERDRAERWRASLSAPLRSPKLP